MSVIRTPDHRLRVFVSADQAELPDERAAVRRAVQRLRLTPVLVDTAPGVPPPRDVSRAYVAQSHVFIGIYGDSYGIAEADGRSALETEHGAAAGMPVLVYVKSPATDRDPRLTALLASVAAGSPVSYRVYSDTEDLERQVVDDLAVLLTERYEHSRLVEAAPAAAPEPAPSALPPDAAEDARAVDLPVAPTALVGREQERATLTELLRRPEVRLVTLTGPGGIGKSRLALAAATDVTDVFADGVRWIDVSTFRDPTLVASGLVHALGLPEAVDRAPLETLVAHLRDRRILLVLDSFERVVAAGRTLAELLARCPQVTLLVTSRTVLRVRGEHDVPVPPLASEGDAGSVPDAVRLFVERAAAADPRFELSDDNAREIARICARLDGLPLAIELAAARVRLLTPAALLSRLDHRLKVLTGGPRDLPERQRALRAALDWDYESLDDAERLVFRRLAACAGRFTLELAEAVVNEPGEPAVDVLLVVESLIDKSLLRQPATVTGPEVRLMMLETVREYAAERLAEAGEDDAVRRRHATAVLAMAEDANTAMRSSDQVGALGRLERDHDNLRAAVRWAAEHGEVDIELRLCAALALFWNLHAHLREGAARLEGAISRSAGVCSTARADVLCGASVFERARHDFVKARTWLDEALDIYRTLGDRRGAALAEKLLGGVAYEEDDPELARQHWERSRQDFRELGDSFGEAQVLNNLGVLARLGGDLDGALSLLSQCLAVAGRGSDRVLVARALMNVASVVRDRGEPRVAIALSRRSALLWQALGDTWDLTDCLEGAAGAAAELGSLDDAARLFGAAAALRDSLGAAIPESERGEYDANVAVVRSSLGDEAFTARWAEGARSTPDEAVARLVSLGESLGVGEGELDAWLASHAEKPTPVT